MDRCSVYAISYGGFVCYRMAEMHPELVEKAVIVSSGVGCTENQKGEQLKKVGIDVVDLLLPREPAGMRLLVELSVYKSNPLRWTPDFVLEEFIDVSALDMYSILCSSLVCVSSAVSHCPCIVDV